MNSSILLPLLNTTTLSLIGNSENIEKLDLKKLAYLNFCDYVEFNIDLFFDSTDFYLPCSDSNNDIFLAKEITEMFDKNKFIVIKNLEKSNTSVMNALIVLLNRLKEKNINNPFVFVFDTKHNLDFLQPILNRTACFDC